MQDRFWEKVGAPAENGCLPWTGALINGYGVMWVDGTNEMAHRIAVKLGGRPIPPGWHVDHLCRNPKCVNINHLEAVTPQINNLRGETITRANTLKMFCPYGHFLGQNNLDSYAKRHRKRACKECIRRRCREWHSRNRDSRLEKMRAYKASRK